MERFDVFYLKIKKRVDKVLLFSKRFK